MKKYYNRLVSLAFSSTAKDTYILFGGNVMSAFLGFVYTLFVARALSVPEFGIFSAALNLVVILASVTDLGISSGAINFVSVHHSSNDQKNVNKYIKAASVTKILATLVICLPIVLFSSFVSSKLLAGGDSSVSIWTALITFSLAVPMLFPFILQAKKKFFPSVVADNSLYLSRLVFALLFMVLTKLTISNSFLSYVLGGLVGTIVGFILIKPGFVNAKPEKKIYKNLFNFSGWIGVNRVISSIYGRLDVQMLAVMAGASATGIYSIAARLAGFIIVLTSSFSNVLAPRLAGFKNIETERKYLKKATLAIFPIVAGLVLWIAIAKPFITLLFGDKYLDAVPVFQYLTAAMIPFVFTAPSVTAIIYSMKKTVFIGAFSFFQLIAIALLNYLFIPKYGVIGPTITLGITNTILAIYSWIIVVKHYRVKDTSF